VVCYDLADGTPLWQYEEPGRHANPMGDVGPRTTPTIDGDGRLYAQGATGKVWCFEAITGALLWKVDLLELADIDQGTFEEHVPWGRSGSPLRVEDLVVLPLGGAPQSPRGTRSLVALDAASGEVRWTSGGHQISYASPVVATIGGVRQIVAVDEDFVSGTGLEDAEELWSEPWPGKSNQGANCSNPIVFPDGRVLVSKEYGGGAKMFRVERSGDRWETEVLWEDHRVLKTKFTNAVVDGGYAYAISNGTMECVDLSDGSRQWRQGRGQRVGNGHLVLVEDALVSSTEQGGIVLVERTPAEYRERGRFSAIEGKTWNPPTVFSNYVLLRNGREMALYRLPPLTPDAAASIARAARESPAAHRTDD
jgi:outer membrane protein assembly factor BamB